MFNRKNMKNYMNEKGLKQKFVALQSGISECNLSLILNGNRKCSVDEYVQICTVLNVSLDKFIDTDDKKDGVSA